MRVFNGNLFRAINSILVAADDGTGGTGELYIEAETLEKATAIARREFLRRMRGLDREVVRRQKQRERMLKRNPYSHRPEIENPWPRLIEGSHNEPDRVEFVAYDVNCLR